MNCYYCDRTRAALPEYGAREAEFDLGSEAPRCPLHWRYVCDHCGEPGHFSSRFHCPQAGELLCGEAGAVTFRTGAFWSWLDWWTIACPRCGGEHPSLERAEFEGIHPWLLDPALAARRAWLSAETQLVRYPPARFERVDGAALTDADLDATWSANADLWDAGYDEHGDLNRRYSSDEVLLSFLGEVDGQRVLDAGSGPGYLSRLLTRRGARLTAVENSARFHQLALAHEAREPLGIDFHHGSISSMPYLADASFDAAVANYVLMDVLEYEAAMAEVARVLKPGGRFVLALVRNTMDFTWDQPAADSPRKDDRLGWRDRDYFVRRAGYVRWGAFQPFLTFHRPLRDYVAAGKAAGLELRDLEEPYLTEEGRRVLPPSEVACALQVPISHVLKFVKP